VNQSGDEKRLQFHVSPDLDYVYRDVVNIYVGPGDVVFELGNRHRSMPDHVTVSNRIVLSVSSAYELQQRLGQALKEAQKQLQESLKKGNQAEGEQS
jgi:hypothetical protein